MNVEEWSSCPLSAPRQYSATKSARNVCKLFTCCAATVSLGSEMICRVPGAAGLITALRSIESRAFLVRLMDSENDDE